MTKVEFNKNTETEYDVMMNGDSYGILKFDADQNVWVLWPDDIDDAVSYFKDLNDTKETIVDELAA